MRQESRKWEEEQAKREAKKEKDAAKIAWKKLIKSILVKKYAAAKFD